MGSESKLEEPFKGLVGSEVPNHRAMVRGRLEVARKGRRSRAYKEGEDRGVNGWVQNGSLFMSGKDIEIKNLRHFPERKGNLNVKKGERKRSRYAQGGTSSPNGISPPLEKSFRNKPQSNLTNT